MADEKKTDPKSTPAGVPTTPAAVVDPWQALEARVTELENTVHTLAQYSRGAEHPGIVAWLKKVGARIEAAVEKVI